MTLREHLAGQGRTEARVLLSDEPDGELACGLRQPSVAGLLGPIQSPYSCPTRQQLSDRGARAESPGFTAQAQVDWVGAGRLTSYIFTMGSTRHLVQSDPAQHPGTKLVHEQLRRFVQLHDTTGP